MSRVWLIGVAAFVLALVVAGLVVALVTTRGGVDLLPADSPEGTVQRYLLALEDEDYPKAYDYLAAGSKDACSFDEFLRQTSYGEVRDSHMTLDDTRIFDGSAVVTATVIVFEPSLPFGASEHTYDRTFQLSLEDGQWRLTGPEYTCPSLY
jgi:hypothetical protein